MKYSNTEKKQLKIFACIAFGLPYLLGLLMWYGYYNGTDLDVFPLGQMMYPAAGVMLAFLITKKEDSLIPRYFYKMFLVITAIVAIVSVFSVLLPYPAWHSIANNVLMFGTAIGWIILFVEDSDKKAAYGLNTNRAKTSVKCVFLFLLLYAFATIIEYVLAGTLHEAADIYKNPATWGMLAMGCFSFFLSFLPFLGEEYGWRYYLQPMLQKRFGLRKGVLLLGLLWGIWHLPINFFYYSSPKYGLASVTGQLITCTTMGIFFAYAYMKTNNIWVPIILHYMNNNLVPIVSGTLSKDVLKNQTPSFKGLLPALILNVAIFGGFLFTKEFRKQKREIS